MANTEQKIIKIVDGASPTIEATVEQIGLQGAIITKTVGGMLVPEKFDLITVTYPAGDTEVYTYTLAASPVAVVTVVYTDATKARVSTVTRT